MTPTTASPSEPTEARDPTGLTVAEALAERRSRREFETTPLSRDDLTELLWAAQGERPDGTRTTPSAGSTYPLQAYATVARVDGLAPGTYAWGPSGSLSAAPGPDSIDRFADLALGDQRWVADAAAIVTLVADLAPITEAFADQPPRGQRPQRYAYLEAGAAAQNLLLAATARGLAAVLVGGFDDDALQGALRLAPTTRPMAFLPVGPPTPAR